LFGVLDDHSRTACHLQWYLAETAENVAQGASQAFQNLGLRPRISGLQTTAYTAVFRKDASPLFSIRH
jgi:putative transposase